jgi:hypothetical protein
MKRKQSIEIFLDEMHGWKVHIFALVAIRTTDIRIQERGIHFFLFHPVQFCAGIQPYSRQRVKWNISTDQNRPEYEVNRSAPSSDEERKIKNIIFMTSWRETKTDLHYWNLSALHFVTLVLSLVSFLFWTLLSSYCRCRRLLVHQITHTHTNTRYESPRWAISPTQRLLPDNIQHSTERQTSTLPAEYEPAISARKRPQNHRHPPSRRDRLCD